MGDQINKKRERLAQDTKTTTNRYKLYKAGSHWVVAGVTTVAFAIGLTTYVAPTTAHASDDNQTADTSAVTDSSNLTAPTTTLTSSASDAESAASVTSQATATETTPESTTTSATKTDNSAVADSAVNNEAVSEATTGTTQPETAQPTQTTSENNVDATTSTDDKSTSTNNSVEVTTDKTTADTNATGSTKTINGLAVTNRAGTTTATVSAVNPNFVDVTALSKSTMTNTTHLTVSGDGGTNFVLNKGVYISTLQVGNASATTDVLNSFNYDPWQLTNYTVQATNTRMVNGQIALTKNSVVKLVTGSTTQLFYVNNAPAMAGRLQTYGLVLINNQTSTGTNNGRAQNYDGPTNNYAYMDAAGLHVGANVSSGNLAINGSMVIMQDIAIRGAAAGDLGVNYVKLRIQLGDLAVGKAQVLKPVINTRNVNLANNTTTLIGGTGTAAGDTITVRTVDGSVSVATTVTAAGTWQLTAAQSAKFAGSANVVAIESNALGDTPGIAAAPQQTSVSRVIKYVMADGTAAPAGKTQTANYKRNATSAGTVAKPAVTYGAWTSSNAAFAAVTTPIETGYVADKATVAAQTAATPAASVVLPTSATVTVTYTPVAKYTFSGTTTQVAPISYTNSTTDPTKVDESQQVIPYVKGYVATVNGTALTPVNAADATQGYKAPTPTSAIKDTAIVYAVDNEQAAVNFIDDTAKATLKTDAIKGIAGDAMVYDSVAAIKAYTDAGYVLVSDGYATASDASKIFDTVADSASKISQTFDIHLTHSTTTYTPTTPGTTVGTTATDLTHAVTITNIFGDPVNTQTTEPSIMFYRTATVDNVTGEVTPGTWTTNATGITAGTDDQSTSLTVLPMNGRKTPSGYSAKVTTTIDGTAVADTSIVTAANTAVVRHIDYTDIMIHVQYVDVDDNNKVVGTISTVGTSFSTRSTDFTTLVTDPETGNELFALEVVQTPTALKAENGSISGTENEAIETFTGAPGQTYVVEVHHAHEQLPVTTTRTINYTYADTTEGTTAAPTQTQTANWTEDIDVYKAAQDGATPADYITYTQDSAYTAVTSPVIAQFVPDVATVAAESIATSPVTTLPTNEVVPVTYTRNVFTTQHPGAYADELTKTVTETVHYISGIDGKTVADDATPSVTFTRSRTNNADGTVTYSNWTPSTQAIAAVTSPDVTDMFTVTKTVPAVNGVTPDSAPADVTVKYYNTKVTVNPHDPQGPKNPNEPVVPDDPDSPVYPAGVTANDLNKTFTETIHFVDGDGKQVADDKVATVHYQRNATVDYSVDPDNPTVSYGNWGLADGQNADYPAFSIPVFTDKVYDTANTTTQGTITNGQYGAVATDPTLDADSGSYVDTVVYKSSIQKLIPSGDIPEGVTVEPLERVITETVHYIDGATGQPLAISGEQVSVTSTRGAQVNINPDAPDDKQVVYGDWSVENLVAIDVPVEVTSDAAETSKTGLVIPAGTKFFTMTTQIPAQTVNGTSDDLNYDVYYYPETVTLTPDNPDSPKDPNEPLDPNNPAGPLFPASGITNEDMHQAVTETISYVDQNGNTVAPAKTITVNYQRSYTVNFNLDGTSTATPGQWTVAPGKDGATVSSTISAVTNPVIAGLITKDKSVAAYATSTTATDGIVTLASDKPVVVTYYPNSVDITPDNPVGEGSSVTPSDPNDPRVYPAGVSADDLNTTATETIRYVDGMTNATLQAPTTGNTLHFVRNAHVVWNQDGSTAVTYDKWTPKTTADQQFESVTVPQVIDGKLADLKQVDAMTETFPIDVTATVYYYGDITVQPDQPVTPGTPINPDDPNSPLYPENTTSPDNPDGTGLTATDLNRTSTRTIQYLSGIDKQTSVAKTGIQTIYFNRVGHLSYNQDGSPKVTYDNWTPADLDSNIYHELNTPVVDGMFTTTESNSEITETVPTDVSETVYYYPAEYTVTPGTPVDPDDPSQVQGPLNPGDSLVPSVTGDENVPNAPEGLTSEYLTRQVTETITYVNGVTGDVLTDAAGQPLTKTVTVNMTRNAHVSYSVIDHKPTVSYDAWTPVTFDAVTSPDVDQMYTTTPVVDQMTVKTPISLHLTVNYYPTNVTVTPITPTDPSDPSVSPKNPGDQLVPTDGKHTPDNHTPVYPAGVTEADLTTTAVETINYIDSKTGEPVHESVTQTLKFYRTANVSFDEKGQGTVVYSDWLPVASDTFGAVESPEIDGYTSNMPTVDAVTETWPVPVSLTVYYYQDYTVTPDQPVAPATSIDPGTPADGETPAKPAIPGSPEVPEGLQDQNLNATATRTIYYVDGVTGQKVASASKQTLRFSRSASVNYDVNGTPQVTYSAWVASKDTGDTFFKQVTPDIENMVTETASIDALTETQPAPVKYVVTYYPEYTVGPNEPASPNDPIGPKDEGTPMNPDGPDGLTYPVGISTTDLNRIVTETVRFIDKTTGKTVAPSIKQTLKFVRTAHVSYTTDGKPVITYTAWTPSVETGSTFPAVKSANVAGMTPDQVEVPALAEMNPAPVTATVYYTANPVVVTPTPEPTAAQEVTPSTPVVGESVTPDETPATTPTGKPTNGKKATTSVENTPLKSATSEKAYLKTAAATSNGQQLQSTAEQSADENSAKKLPQTSESQTETASLIGLLGLSMLGLVGLGKKRKRED